MSWYREMHIDFELPVIKLYDYAEEFNDDAVCDCSVHIYNDECEVIRCVLPNGVDMTNALSFSEEKKICDEGWDLYWDKRSNGDY